MRGVGPETSAALVNWRQHFDLAREEERLARAGATEVIQPELEAAATLIRHALRGLALPQPTVLDYLARFRAA